MPALRIRPPRSTAGTSLEHVQQFDWRQLGACRGSDPRWWDLDGPTDTPGNIAARQICASCPVQKVCRAAANVEKVEGVIRGGRRYEETDPVRRCWTCDRKLKDHTAGGRPPATCAREACAEPYRAHRQYRSATRHLRPALPAAV
jgi:hypothetical protein